MNEYVLVLIVPFRGRDRFPIQAEDLTEAESNAQAMMRENAIPQKLYNYVALCPPKRE
jgi:hypothetical protein